MAWQNPIYDRTIDDVINRTSKGYENLEDLQRQLGNIEYLSTISLPLLYFFPVFQSVVITRQDNIPFLDVIETIEGNLRGLENFGIVLPSGWLVSDWDSGKNPDFNDINRWESNASQMKDVADRTIKRFKVSGALVAGQQSFLPRGMI